VAFVVFISDIICTHYLLYILFLTFESF
jgi:hypothetical protein